MFWGVIVSSWTLEKAVMMSDAVGIESFFRKGQEQKTAWPPRQRPESE